MMGFNPRTPCGVRRRHGGTHARHAWFQSTHSLRSATDLNRLGGKLRCRFNPRTPCGVRPGPEPHAGRPLPVSIHALLAECDSSSVSEVPGSQVSIHALLAECDVRDMMPPVSLNGFNPRTPCGVRHSAPACCHRQHKFQSTHSLRSATEAMPSRPINVTVSIHALLAECDLSAVVGVSIREPFQSTHSLRSATAPNLIHCYSTKQIILCANLPKKTVIARLLFLSIYLSIFYSQCITPIADLPGNSCELEVGAQAMFNSL